MKKHISIARNFKESGDGTLCVLVMVNHTRKEVLFVTGEGDTFHFPFSFFTTPGRSASGKTVNTSVNPDIDFTKPCIVDYGMSVGFGPGYEASFDPLLLEAGLAIRNS